MPQLQFCCGLNVFDFIFINASMCVTWNLQVYRDYKATNDIQYLKDMWPIAKVPSTIPLYGRSCS